MKKIASVTFVALLFVFAGPMLADDVDDLVAQMIKTHAIKSIHPDDDEAQIYHAFWERCELDQKRQLVNIVSVYCKNHGGSGAVTLLDARSGEKLASYSSWSGITIGDN